MLRKEKPKKRFRPQTEDTTFRPKRKKTTPKQKYKNHQIWLEEEEELDLDWKEENSLPETE